MPGTRPAWARAVPAALLALTGVVAAQSLPVVSYPANYQTTLVKYAVVDPVDGLSRDLYVSPDALAAVRREPRLRELPPGVLFALDVHSARPVGRDRKTRGPRFERPPTGIWCGAGTSASWT